jgi:hypothetical protein
VVIILYLNQPDATCDMFHDKVTHAKISSTVIVPASSRVHKTSGVQLSDPIGQFELGVVICDLTPSFVVYDLSGNLC